MERVSRLYLSVATVETSIKLPLQLSLSFGRIEKEKKEDWIKKNCKFDSSPDQDDETRPMQRSGGVLQECC